MKLSSLKDKVVVITGGYGGLGECLSLDFARQGAHIIPVGRDMAQAVQLVEKVKKIHPVRCLPQQADIADTADVKKMIAAVINEFKRIDILVNNAAVGFANRIEAYSADEWRRPIDVNLNGSYYCIKHALPHMKKQAWGRIINIASIQGRTGFPYTGSYTVSKHALIGLTRVTAAETAKEGITCNAVCPGFFTADSQELQEDSARRDEQITGVSMEETLNQVLDQIPLGRFQEAAEVSALVLFLASAAASGITGQAINVDGGMRDLFTIPRPPRSPSDRV